MQMVVVTTITTSLDVETMTPTHKVEVEDQDGLSEIHPDVLGAILIGACHATIGSLRKQFPGAARSDVRVAEHEAVDIEQEAGE